MSCNTPHYTIPFCPHLGVQGCLCIPASTTSPSSSLGCLPPRFHSGREAAPVFPSLFTLLFSSIYSALQHPGARCSKQLLHYGERGSSECAAPPHSSLSIPPSLSDSPPWLHEHASHCRHKARPPSMPAWLPGAARAKATVREGLRKPQKDKLPKFGFWLGDLCGRQFGHNVDKLQSHPDDLRQNCRQAASLQWNRFGLLFFCCRFVKCSPNNSCDFSLCGTFCMGLQLMLYA